MKGADEHRGELRHFRLDEDLEAKLFAVVDQLNRTQYPNRRSKLTQEKADTIQQRAAAGTLQKTLAGQFKVALYTLAGLDWGRVKGLTWHTTRHEFISRVAETTKNPRDAQEAARHKRLETTQRYMHVRRDRRWEVAHGLNR